MRVVVWSTSRVKKNHKGKSGCDHYVSAKYGRGDEHETDTHWKARSGDASFNWRMKWPVTLTRKGAVNDRLELQLWDRDITMQNEALASVTLDLGDWAQRCYWSHRVALEEKASADDVATTGHVKTALPGQPPKAKAVANAKRRPIRSYHYSDAGRKKLPYRLCACTCCSSIIRRLREGPDNKPPNGATGQVHRFWVPLMTRKATLEEKQVDDEEAAATQDVESASKAARAVDKKLVKSGYVRLSVELVPKELIDNRPAGSGRSAPNDFPRLPEPVGRVSLNPADAILDQLLEAIGLGDDDEEDNPLTTTLIAIIATLLCLLILYILFTIPNLFAYLMIGANCCGGGGSG